MNHPRVVHHLAIVEETNIRDVLAGLKAPGMSKDMPEIFRDCYLLFQVRKLKDNEKRHLRGGTRRIQRRVNGLEATSERAKHGTLRGRPEPMVARPKMNEWKPTERGRFKITSHACPAQATSGRTGSSRSRGTATTRR